jgi:stage II sporulation protein P
MSKVRKIKYLAWLCCLCLTAAILSAQSVAASQAEGVPTGEIECSDGSYYTLYDEHHQMLTRTGLGLSQGDEYITADNLRYRVVSVSGNSAYARLINREATPRAALPVATSTVGVAGSGRPFSIAIYHTHSDESYVPTDGTSSIYGQGGIFKVGDALTDEFKKLHMQVEHSLRPHDPHDINAYVRSRRTAVQLLQKNPAAIFDVHRDAVPPDVYATSYKGEPITRVKIVVGRTNPRVGANLAFAREVKTAVDQKTPGVIEGILLARGDYNQDLSPHSLLFEVGAHTNSRYDAQRGISVFAQSLPAVISSLNSSPQGNLPPATTATNQAAWRVALLIVIVAALGLTGFLYLNHESWTAVKGRINRLWGHRLDLKRRLK